MNVSNEKYKGNEKGAAVIYRFVGYYLAKWLVRCSVTPNFLTMCGFIFGVAASYFFSLGGHFSLVSGAIFYQLCIILDYSDGTLARLTKTSSYLGQWLEAVLDPLREFVVIFGICWGLSHADMSVFVWILGFILCGTNFMMDIQVLSFESFPFANEEFKAVVSKSWVYTIASHLLTIRTTRYLFTMFFAVMDWMFLFLVLFSLYNILLFLIISWKVGMSVKLRDQMMS